MSVGAEERASLTKAEEGNEEGRGSSEDERQRDKFHLHNWGEIETACTEREANLWRNGIRSRDEQVKSEYLVDVHLR